MLTVISIIVFVIFLGGIAVHCLLDALRSGYKWSPGNILRTLVHLFTLIFIEQKLNLIGAARKIVYLVGLLCFVVLVVTGFCPVIFGAGHLSGYALMIHATFSPVFAACVAILAVLWAQNCLLDKNYWPWLLRVLQRQPANNAKPARYEFLTKICFWLILVLSLPVILSIVLSMFPLFGTAGQHFLLWLHGYSALALAAVIILHTHLMVRAGTDKVE